MNKENKKQNSVFTSQNIEMNNYTKTDPKKLLTQTQKWVTNGKDNEVYYDYAKAFNGSPTASNILSKLVRYILADGIKYTNSIEDVTKIIDEEDLELIIRDHQMNGAIAMQIVYTVGSFIPGQKKEIAKIHHIPVKSVAFNKMDDIRDTPDGYWICEWWSLKNKFIPYFIPRFGTTQTEPTELYYASIPSDQPLFAEPRWVSGQQWMQTQEEISNFVINHVKKSFKPSVIINVNKDFDGNFDLMEKEANAMLNAIEGTTNGGSTVISYAPNKDQASTIEIIDTPDAYQRYEFVSKHSIDMLMQAFSITSPSLFGLPQPTGFASQADGTEMNLKIMYRDQINPDRKWLLRHIEKVINYFSEFDKKIEFIDFADLNVITPSQPAAAPILQNTTLAATKIGFDYDGTASTIKGQEMIDKAIADGDEVYLISARESDTDLLVYATEHGILHSNVFATGDNTKKEQKVKDLALSIFWDNNQDVVDALPSIGKLFINN